ncbi:N-acetyltransferase [Pigmentiphaga sp. H8]|uniref:GNAT family N-acetyltransferase n=1 Tax=Pigmentiphaga sp. H8 TaxID=2488560 RepID=UPI000F596258|nr:N-acetyltransferase [Pigmentiphaga sp. H8]AZG07596.1 N-acetyltransferase [Pigmentiphaga sp. H8]
MLIRPEQPQDIAAIERVITRAFATAPHTSGTEAKIVDALREAGALALSLVAETDGEVVGHVALSPVALSGGAPGWYGLGPLAVAPEHQGKGVGGHLVAHALDALRQRHAAGCVVLGEPEYYGRFGFRADPDFVLPGVPPEYFQVVRFMPGADGGAVTYHQAFEVAA